MSDALYGAGKARGPDVARRLVKTFSGPTATVYACPFCAHFTKMPKGRPGVGRGYGLRVGGGLSSQMAAHIRAEHPAQVEAAKAAA